MFLFHVLDDGWQWLGISEWGVTEGVASWTWYFLRKCRTLLCKWIILLSVTKCGMDNNYYYRNGGSVSFFLIFTGVPSKLVNTHIRPFIKSWHFGSEA